MTLETWTARAKLPSFRVFGSCRRSRPIDEQSAADAHPPQGFIHLPRGAEGEWIKKAGFGIVAVGLVRADGDFVVNDGIGGLLALADKSRRSKKKFPPYQRQRSPAQKPP
jgi:hypothetical protein